MPHLHTLKDEHNVKCSHSNETTVAINTVGGFQVYRIIKIICKKWDSQMLLMCAQCCVSSIYTDTLETHVLCV